MTLCIAAISERDDCIVAVSDLMLSSDHMGSEEVLFTKVEVLPPTGRWIMLYSGDQSVRMEVARLLFPRLGDREHGSAGVKLTLSPA